MWPLLYLPKGEVKAENLNYRATDMTALIRGLMEESFSGYVEILALHEKGLIVFVQGRVLSCYYEGTDELNLTKEQIIRHFLQSETRERDTVINIYNLPSEIIEALSALETPPAVQRELESSFLDMHKLVETLAQKKFSGVLRFYRIRNNTRLGNLLLRMNKISPEQLKEAVRLQLSQAGAKRLGDALVEIGAIAPSELEDALDRQSYTRKGSDIELAIVVFYQGRFFGGYSQDNGILITNLQKVLDWVSGGWEILMDIIDSHLPMPVTIERVLQAQESIEGKKKPIAVKPLLKREPVVQQEKRSPAQSVIREIAEETLSLKADDLILESTPAESDLKQVNQSQQDVVSTDKNSGKKVTSSAAPTGEDVGKAGTLRPTSMASAAPSGTDVGKAGTLRPTSMASAAPTGKDIDGKGTPQAPRPPSAAPTGEDIGRKGTLRPSSMASAAPTGKDIDGKGTPQAPRPPSAAPTGEDIGRKGTLRPSSMASAAPTGKDIDGKGTPQAPRPPSAAPTGEDVGKAGTPRPTSMASAAPTGEDIGRKGTLRPSSMASAAPSGTDVGKAGTPRPTSMASAAPTGKDIDGKGTPQAPRPPSAAPTGEDVGKAGTLRPSSMPSAAPTGEDIGRKGTLRPSSMASAAPSGTDVGKAGTLQPSSLSEAVSIGEGIEEDEASTTVPETVPPGQVGSAGNSPDHFLIRAMAIFKAEMGFLGQALFRMEQEQTQATGRPISRAQSRAMVKRILKNATAIADVKIIAQIENDLRDDMEDEV